MGLRRVGKTSLCKSLDNTEYFDCERPRVRQLLEDPEGFLQSQKGKRIVFDEIHRLENPSEILKLAADHYPEVKIIATGSSTLGASAKFKDTLTGRKREIWLTPLLLQELADFGNDDLMHRFLCGGLPSFFSQKQLPEEDFKEWIDAYWAKDIQDLFSVGKRYSFQKFAELLLAHSGGQFEATKYTAPCEITRHTVGNYLAILEETFVIQVARPFSTHKASEIVLAPKVYGFDTGFVCFSKGWGELRKEDCGLMWEQIVLNEIQAHFQTRALHYWRDKQGHEIDFVIPHKYNKTVTAIECKFKIGGAKMSQSMIAGITKNIKVFRNHYPEGLNIVVAHDIDTPFMRELDGVTLTFVNPQELIKKLHEQTK